MYLLIRGAIHSVLMGVLTFMFCETLILMQFDGYEARPEGSLTAKFTRMLKSDVPQIPLDSTEATD